MGGLRWSLALAALLGARASKSNTSIATPKIIGGQVVSPAFSFPFIVGIAEAGYYCCQCGGSLIASEWVLTAAHCIESSGSYTALIYGHSSRMAEGYNNDCTEQIPVSQKICHTEYDAETNENDVCLLRLSYAPSCAGEMQDNGQFALLDTPNSGRANAGNVVTIAGWGLTVEEDSNSSPDLMHYTTTTMVSRTQCSIDYVNANTAITQSMICAGESGGGKDTCQGDSGGPLFVKEGSSFVQIGVVSFGVGCGRADFPGVYASVAYFRSWINGVVASSPSPPPPPPVSGICTNTCTFAGDSECDDGGPGSVFSGCSFGTDCQDCGPRPDGYLCFNDCSTASDGDCDDGGSGSEYSLCSYGHDCVDCGGRGSSSSSPPPPASCGATHCMGSCAADTCEACGCGGCAACAGVVVSVIASGTVGDFEDTSALKLKFALAADVSAAYVDVSVVAASVEITATISIPSGTTAEQIETRLNANLGTAAAASAALGVDVQENPRMSRELSPTTTILGMPLMIFIAIVVGSVVGVIVLVVIIVLLSCCCCSRQKSSPGRGMSPNNASRITPNEPQPVPVLNATYVQPPVVEAVPVVAVATQY
eukprot:scaffold213983_cov31-Tisochrysis_lutea.AAC.2